MKKLPIALILVMVAGVVSGDDFRAGDIVIDHPYALAGGTSVYLRTLRNSGKLPDRLLGASSPTLGRVALLLDMKASLRLGDTVALTLHFENAGKVTVPADVVDGAARRSH